jgi:hypothetical protein
MRPLKVFFRRPDPQNRATYLDIAGLIINQERGLAGEQFGIGVRIREP